ncbi:MAG TPA: ABC transporter permease subunit [Candidatus Saccharimonadales bacterium]|jgi:ABC-2 type transport system permease protein|nr:ABC transporter permease subunit [Candidatus Saccharimonadales bacterium]
MKVAAIIRIELWQRRRALAWWSLGVAVLVGLDMLLYLSLKNNAQDINKVVESLPNTVRELFAGSGDFTSQAGFLSGRIYYLLLPLLLTILAIGLGSSLIGKEEREGTLELLLARPVSRLKLLLSKVSAGTLAMAGVGFVALIVGLICLRPAGLNTISLRAVTLVTLNVVVLSSLFGMIAFCLTALGGRFRNMATAVAALIAFGGYLVASLQSLTSWMVWPARLMPYHYYDPSAILKGASYGLKPLLGFSITIVLLLVASWVGFRRRDIG